MNSWLHQGGNENDLPFRGRVFSTLRSAPRVRMRPTQRPGPLRHPSGRAEPSARRGPRAGCAAVARRDRRNVFCQPSGRFLAGVLSQHRQPFNPGGRVQGRVGRARDFGAEPRASSEGAVPSRRAADRGNDPADRPLSPDRRPQHSLPGRLPRERVLGSRDHQPCRRRRAERYPQELLHDFRRAFQ